jgi:alkylhydroperoxidase/carboxymuconolactone decarboxylase family protein YurZ
MTAWSRKQAEVGSQLRRATHFVSVSRTLEELNMNSDTIPKHYQSLKERFPEVIAAVEDLGKTAKTAGPIDEKVAHLIQMAAATAIRSHGAVRSHAKRALEAGASTQELYHSVLVLVSTLGFPVVAAAIGWIDDVVDPA